MPQLEQPIPHRLRQRFPVALAVTELVQADDDRREVAWIALLQIQEKLANRATPCLSLIEFYGELHVMATSILM